MSISSDLWIACLEDAVFAEAKTDVPGIGIAEMREHIISDRKS